MHKNKSWIIITLTIFFIVFVFWKFTKQEYSKFVNTENQEQTSIINSFINSHTLIYNHMGKLAYKLSSDKVIYFSKKKLSCFHNPIMISYNENKIPIWLVYADRAMLTKEQILYMYDHVGFNLLTKGSQLKSIETYNAQVNLITQDILSEDKVIVYGRNFSSIGMKIRGNLRTKTAELLGKVKTYYAAK